MGSVHSRYEGAGPFDDDEGPKEAEPGAFDEFCRLIRTTPGWYGDMYLEQSGWANTLADAAEYAKTFVQAYEEPTD